MKVKIYKSFKGYYYTYFSKKTIEKYDLSPGKQEVILNNYPIIITICFKSFDNKDGSVRIEASALIPKKASEKLNLKHLQIVDLEWEK